uniref:THAP-type domain-containing protein n=1 Tax=Mastacembelus armatus TaxID=205130 RepID=A0A3Q3SZ89_9TELE
MSLKKTRVFFLKQERQYHEHCCVPMCTSSSKFNGVLSFHGFPRDVQLRKRWLVNIRRDKFTVTAHTVPVLFQWNDYSIPSPRLSVWDRVSTPEPSAGDEQLMDCTPAADHDYSSVPEPAFLDTAVDKHMQLEEKIDALMKEIQELKLLSTFGIERFAQSDVNIRFYTRQSLQPIDELFLFLMYLSVGLKEQDLANRFNIHTSTVSRIITSWTNYLYTLLGSVSIWIDAEIVKAHLPDDFKDFPDTQVIVDCTELKCQTPSSPLLQSEMFSTYKSHCTMKGLIGIAPHGPVTFVSSLYEGSVSDKELFRRSGLADLLTEDMAVMVDKGFLITDCVKCKVYCPPFLKKSSQMPAPSVLLTQKIARLRVHVERVIQRVKENKLFDSVIPLSIAGSINEIFAVAYLNDITTLSCYLKVWNTKH